MSEWVLLLSYFLLTYILCIFVNLVLFQNKNHPAKRTLLFASASLLCASPLTRSEVSQLQEEAQFQMRHWHCFLTHHRQDSQNSTSFSGTFVTCIMYFIFISTCLPVSTEVKKAKVAIKLAQTGAHLSNC